MYLSLGIIILLCCLSPGPDFVLVTKNTLAGSRKLGVYTAFGIASACLIHTLYNILGIGILIKSHQEIFTVIQYIGAIYLIYIGALGMKSIISVGLKGNDEKESNYKESISLTNYLAWKQGILCNLLNPKAYLFFISIFTILINPKSLSILSAIFITIEIFLIVFIWFALLSIIYSHKILIRIYKKFSLLIDLVLSIGLISLGVLFIFV